MCRTDCDNLYLCWCEVVAGQGKDQPPYIIEKFPHTYNDQETLNSIPQFVYPCKIEKREKEVQMFTFVLTAGDSSFMFGFCRHSPNASSAIVIMSHLPWDSTFSSALNVCANLQSSENPENLWSFLKEFYEVPVPLPGESIHFAYPPNNMMFTSKCPNSSTLASIPENVSNL